MDLKSFFKKNVIHIAILISFFISMYAYFSMQFDGHGLKQHDIAMYKGMANEIIHHREAHNGEDPLWTNSMFGGMPATQISVDHPGNIFHGITRFLRQSIPAPGGIFLLHLICFYLMGLMLRVRPLIAALGAFAFAFASYEIIILQAGHNSKAMAVAFAPPVIGAFVMAYRRNWKWGAVLSMIFMGFEIAQNHLQVTYYLGMLILGLGVYELICVIRKKKEDEPAKFKTFGIKTAALIGAYGIALFVNYGNIKMTNDYSKHTIRGKNEISVKPDGTANAKQSGGLDKDYITNWSYGKGESFTLLSPYVKGSHSSPVIASNFAKNVESSDLSEEEKADILEPIGYYSVFNRLPPMYFGQQSMTSGPVYVGVVVVFLALLALVMLKSPVKWVYFSVAFLALLLSWGKNLEWLTDFFVDHVPMYNKFRTVTIILVLIEMCIPILGILILQQLWDERDELKEKRKTFLITAGSFLIVLIGLKATGINDSYATEYEKDIDKYLRTEQEVAADVRRQIAEAPKEQLLANGIDKDNPDQVDQVVSQQVSNYQNEIAPIKRQITVAQKFRKDMESSSWTRSIVFGFFAIAIVSLFFYTAVPAPVIVGALAVLVLIDLVVVDKNYLGEFEYPEGESMHWTSEGNALYPHEADPADRMIMEEELRSNPGLRDVVKKGEEKGREIADATDFEEDTKERIIDSYKFQALNAATNYRVFDYRNPFNDARTSYFHKSLGGYHGAKLQNIQNLIDFQIAEQNTVVLDMLNVKYIETMKDDKDKNGKPIKVPVGLSRESRGDHPMGNAWLAKKVEVYDTPLDELTHLGLFMKFENVGSGTLLVNGKSEKAVELHLGQKPRYVLGKDTFDIRFDWGNSYMEAGHFVLDGTSNKTEIYPDNQLAMDTANVMKKLVKMTRTYKFSPMTTTVMVKSEASKLSKKEFTGEGQIKMTSYAPNKLTYEAEVNGDQLAVFSEVYYSGGWKAFVDGKEQPILKVNYLLRGLELKSGKHKIEFVFDIPAYHSANTFAYIGSILVFLLIGAVFYLDWKSKKTAA